MRCLSGSLLSVALVGFIASNAHAQSMRLGDVAFAQALCQAWNQSELPKRLASKDKGGSGWIDVVTTGDAPSGMQKIVSGRADCQAWPKFELLISKQADGTAMCEAAGPYNGKNLTWQFVPSTANWFEFGVAFGMGAFYDLWSNGMIGNKGTAWSNSDNFFEFFKLAAKLGLASDWQGGCDGLAKAEVDEAVADLKKEWNVR